MRVARLLHRWGSAGGSATAPKRAAADRGDDADRAASPTALVAAASSAAATAAAEPPSRLPRSAFVEAWQLWRRWRSGRWRRVPTRAHCDVELDVTPRACARASAALGLRQPLFAGDRVRCRRSCGRMLEQPEDAIVLGAHRGMLWYLGDAMGI